MEPVDYIIRARLLITDPASERWLDDAALAIRGALVVAVDHYNWIIARYCSSRFLGSERSIILPGFINAHSHPGRPLRDGTRDAPLETWLVDRLRQIEGQDENAIYAVVRQSCREYLANAITAVLDCLNINASLPYYGLEAALTAYIESGIRASVLVTASDSYEYFERYAGLSSGQLRDFGLLRTRPRSVAEFDVVVKHLVQKYQHTENRIQILIGPNGLQWCSPSLLREILRIANCYDVGLHTHFLETRHEFAFLEQLHGPDFLSRLESIGLFSPRTSFAHVLHLPAKHVPLLRECGVVVIRSPSTAMRLYDGLPLMQPLEGCAVAIGTDGMGFNDDNDILLEMRLLDLFRRAESKAEIADIQRHSGWDNLYRHGAHALGIERIGRLEAGSYADLVEIDFPDAIDSRFPSVLEYMGQRLTRAHVISTMVNGVPVHGWFEQRGEPPQVC